MALFRCVVQLVLVCVVSLNVARAESGKYVRVSTLFNYPPYCFYKEGAPHLYKEIVPPGKDALSFQGVVWDILRDSFHARGYTIELIISPWARALSNVRDGTADLLFPAAINPERLRYFEYSQVPINRANFRVYIKKDSGIEWQGLGALQGKIIGMVRGYYLGDEWRKQAGINKYPISSIEQGFHMLQAERLDGFAGYETTWDYILLKMGWQEQFEKLPVFADSQEYLVGIKTNQDTLHLLNEFDAGLASIKASGVYQRTMQRWSMSNVLRPNASKPLAQAGGAPEM